MGADLDAAVRFAVMTELFFLGTGMVAALLRVLLPWMSGLPVTYMVLLAMTLAAPVVVGREQGVDARTAAAGTGMAVAAAVVLFLVLGNLVGQTLLMPNGFMAAGAMLDAVFGANPATLTAMAWCAPAPLAGCPLLVAQGLPAVVLGGGMAVGVAYVSRRRA